MAKTSEKPTLPSYMPVKPSDKPPYPVGTPVLIVRPHLWSGCVGVVYKIWDNKSQILTIWGKNGRNYTSLAWPEQLRPWPWGRLWWDSTERSKL